MAENKRVLQRMELALATKLQEKSYDYLPIDNPASLAKIHRLYFGTVSSGQSAGFERGVKEKPTNAIECLYFGIEADLRGDVIERLRYLIQGTKMNHVYCLYSLGHYYSSLADPGQTTSSDLSLAIHYYERAAELNFISAWHRLGMIYERQKNYPEMLRCYFRCLELVQADPYFDPSSTVEQENKVELIFRLQLHSNRIYRATLTQLKSYCLLHPTLENLKIALRYDLEAIMGRMIAQLEHQKIDYLLYVSPRYLPMNLRLQRTERVKEIYQQLMQSQTYFRWGISDLNRKIFEYLFEEPYRPYRPW